MAAATVNDRLEKLEKLSRRLERTTSKLRRENRETRDRVDHLEKIIGEIPDRLAEKVEEATNNQTLILKTEIAESETRQADRVTGVARQWPASALVGVTASIAVVTAMLANWALAASHLPHVH